MEQSKNNELDSMYAAYREEFEKVYTVFEPAVGFSNYKIEKSTDEGIEIYVQEVYIAPSQRGKRFAAELTDKAIAHAEQKFDRPVKKVYTTIGIGGETIDLSLRAITDYGFKLIGANEQLIYFEKKLLSNQETQNE